jgi:hypothetical protein
MCEYGAPCRKVRTAGKGLDYKFRGEYSIVKEDPSDLAKLDFGAPFFKRANTTMTASLRPVYFRAAGGGRAPHPIRAKKATRTKQQGRTMTLTP